MSKRKQQTLFGFFKNMQLSGDNDSNNSHTKVQGSCTDIKGSINKTQLSIFSDETLNERNIGVKISIEPDKASNFGIEKGRSKSADVLKNLAHSTKSELASLYKDNKEFQLHIKSKKEDQDEISEAESSMHSDDWEDSDTPSVDIDEVANKCNVTSDCNDKLEIDISEVASPATQTKTEFQASSAQTSGEVCYPKNTQKTYVQTENWSDVATSTDVKETETVKIETDAISKTQKSVQTDKEIVSGSTQTEYATICSIDRAYDVSTQTDDLADAATSTDFDIYIVDRENLCDQDVDTEDLPYVPLILAKEEVVKADKRQNEEVNSKCCTCKYLNQNDSIQNCCCCTQKEMSPNPQCYANQRSVSCSSAISICDHCHCFCKLHNNKISACNTKSNFNNSSQCCSNQQCSQHPIQEQETDSKNTHENHETVENLIPIQHFDLTQMQYSSIVSQEKPHISHVEVAKDLNYGLKMKTITAVKLLDEIRTENTVVFKIPVIIQHFLTSFCISAYNPSRVIINPIDISHSVSQSGFNKESIVYSLEANAKSTLRSEVKDDSKNQLLMFSDGMNTKSVIVSPMTSLVPHDDKHACICLCRSCYIRIQHVIKAKPTLPLQQDSKLTASTEITENLSSTLPKFKRKNFDYTSRDPWKPLKKCDDSIQSIKIEAANIVHFGRSSSEESIESFKGIDLASACEAVNDHLLCLRPVDENKLKMSAETLHKEWFKAAATKHSNLHTVRNYLQFFEEFSYNLLKTLLHSVDNNGNNVLHFAFANNRFDLIEELLRCGYAVDLLTKNNKSGNSPLMICAISEPKIESDWSIVQKSFEMGDVDIKSVKSGQTPLMNAASCGSYHMVKLLLNAGAKLNLQDKDGSTALMYAAEHGHEKCIKELVGHKKCDPTLKDKDGQTACSIALASGHKNIAVLIHMQSLERRRLSKTYSSKRYIWTSTAEKKKVPPVRQKF